MGSGLLDQKHRMVVAPKVGQFQTDIVIYSVAIMDKVKEESAALAFSFSRPLI